MGMRAPRFANHCRASFCLALAHKGRADPCQVYPSVFRAPRRSSPKEASTSRPHHLSIHTAFDRLDLSRGEKLCVVVEALEAPRSADGNFRWGGVAPQGGKVARWGGERYVPELTREYV